MRKTRMNTPFGGLRKSTKIGLVSVLWAHCANAAEPRASWAPEINVGPEVSQGLSEWGYNGELAEADIGEWLGDLRNKDIPAWSTEDQSEESVLLAYTEDEFANPDA